MKRCGDNRQAIALEREKQARRRVLGCSVVLVITIFVILELFFRHLDKQQHFHRWVTNIAGAADIRLYPEKHDPADFVVPKPVRLQIRAPESAPGTTDYVIGGVEVEEARLGRHSQMKYISPEDLSRDRKNIFIVGASAAFGFPYEYHESFAGLLANDLENQGYSVYNASASYQTTCYIANDLKTIVEYFEPHAIIIYPAYNDFVSWFALDGYGPGRLLRKAINISLRSRFITWIQYTILHNLAAVQDEFRNLFTGYRIHAELYGIDYTLEHPLHRYSTYDPRRWPENRQLFLDAYERNLRFMVEYATENNVPVILMNSPVNYRLSPGFKHPQPEFLNPANKEKVGLLIRQAARQYRAGEYEKALLTLDRALKLEPYPPVIHYLRGMALEALGRHPEAEKAYETCQDNMLGNLGSVVSCNRIIENIAEDYHASLVNLKEIFDRYSHRRERYYNQDLIDDDCHPNRTGHRLIYENVLLVIE